MVFVGSKAQAVKRKSASGEENPRAIKRRASSQQQERKHNPMGCAFLFW